MDYSVSISNASSSDLEDITSLISAPTTTAININGIISSVTRLAVPASVVSSYGNSVKLVGLSEELSLSSDHEYTLKFKAGSSYALNTSFFAYLQFYNNSGEVIRSQEVLEATSFGSSDSQALMDFEINFKPDTAGLSSYFCRLEFYFTTVSSTGCAYYVSSDVYLNDNDDDSGWFQKIINKIEETISNIKEIPSKINQKLTELKEGIGSFFSEQWNNLQAAFSNIGTWFIELGDKFNEAIGAVGEFIVNGLRESLAWAFVPSEDFMDTFIEDIRNTYEEHFGIFAQVTLFLTDTLDYIGTLMDYDYEFTFPEVSVPIAGKTYVIIEEQTVNMEQWLENGSVGAELYSIYQTCVWAILIYCIFKYALIVEDVILSGTSSIFTKEVMKVV